MKIKYLTTLLLLTLLLSLRSRADEGMWIPLLIEKYNIKLMQEKGFKLSAEDIYNVNKASMKDAVLIFGGGCTGEIISDNGLLITNHHCGRGNVQAHSSLEHDYLTNGFWAMSPAEELPNPGLTVTILKRMEDVTDRVLKGVSDEMNGSQRQKIINDNIAEIQKEAVRDNDFQASVRPFFMGNQYFLFINEVFYDVRLVGVPPSSIGNFGGDTDNWMWPRHTGDFSIFRIYAGRDNKPAGYSKENVPYKPAYHFPVSLKGVREGDFTMVLGYPGSTNEYVPSLHVDMYKNHIYPPLIDIRTKKIEIMKEAMESDPLIRIKYYAKVAGISNSWKKWMGEIQGLDRMNAVNKKQEDESKFLVWVNSDPVRDSMYGNLFDRYRTLYDTLKIYNVVNTFTSEVLNGAESLSLSSGLGILEEMYEAGADEQEISSIKEKIISEADEVFRNYDLATDKRLFANVMKMYGERLEEKWLFPGYLKLRKKYSNDFEKLSDEIYDRSPFTGQERFNDFVRRFSASSIKKLRKDPFYKISSDAGIFLTGNVRNELLRLNSELQQLHRKYMKARMESAGEKMLYPDANFTLRVAYGEVQGYKPRDAVHYNHYSTLSGIIEKDNPAIYDYDVPDKLKDLYARKDFGKYAHDGDVPVCFIADNHTTGGNSGSPVLNADGHLIGVNFDRAWEGVASDMVFDPEVSRNISLDIRFALFIIDKFAGAGYLLDEMTIIE